jgi:hypothetical protein
MPTRLIDVGDEESPTKLIEPATFGVTSAYLALSHRWGGACIIQTTQANLGKHKECIPSADLCVTFQDAMVMTRKLGYRYI